MNCATHQDVAAVAYCRTCGKPLCANCSRSVQGVIYCEPCLAARLEGVQPQQVPYQTGSIPPAGFVAPPVSSGPNPGIAGILAGIFPFGVGAVYTGQYAKGLAHLGILVLAIALLGSDLPWYVITTVAIGLGFFYVYQIIDAINSAKAIQAGRPAPDPFGLSRTFGVAGASKTDVPTGAVVLIGLGIMFLLHTVDVFRFDRLWPLILIAIGAWIFARRWGIAGPPSSACQCDRCRAQGLMGPAILVTLGVLFLIGHLVPFFHTWPVLLIVIGLVKVYQGNASTAGHIEVPPSGGLPPMPPPGPPPVPPSSSEVSHG
jgi:hypothetical protein